MAARKKPIKVPDDATCKQITDLILRYLSGSLEPRVKGDFEQHLADCPDCVAFLNTYKKTTALVRSLNPLNMPPTVRGNFLDFIRRRQGKR